MENSKVSLNEEAVVSSLLSDQQEANSDTMDLSKEDSIPIEVDDVDISAKELTDLEQRDETSTSIILTSPEIINTTDGISSDEEEEEENPSDVPVPPSQSNREGSTWFRSSSRLLCQQLHPGSIEDSQNATENLAKHRRLKPATPKLWIARSNKPGIIFLSIPCTASLPF
jgi:hypothetical protein